MLLLRNSMSLSNTPKHCVGGIVSKVEVAIVLLQHVVVLVSILLCICFIACLYGSVL